MCELHFEIAILWCYVVLFWTCAFSSMNIRSLAHVHCIQAFGKNVECFEKCWLIKYILIFSSELRVESFWLSEVFRSHSESCSVSAGILVCVCPDRDSGVLGIWSCAAGSRCARPGLPLPAVWSPQVQWGEKPLRALSQDIWNTTA